MGSDTFFSFPYVFKLLQSVNAVILIICIGLAEPVPSNGVVWFIIISSLTVSVTATIISVLGVQDQFLSSLCNNGITWEILELIYSFVFTILSAVSVWLCFSFIQLVVKGPSGGYVAGGMFMLLHMALYAIPAFLLFDKIQVSQRDPFEPLMGGTRSQDPFQETPYQSQA